MTWQGQGQPQGPPGLWQRSGQPQGQPGQGLPPGPVPQGVLEAAAWAAAVLAALVLALPVLMVSALAWAFARRASAHTRAVVTVLGVLLATIEALAWPGWRTATARYALPYQQIWAQLHHHHHVTALAVLGTLWVAVPVGLLAGLMVGVVEHHRKRAQRQAGGDGQAQDAGPPRAAPRQLRPLVVRRVLGDRVVLGRLDGKLVAATRESHTAIIAPTRSGKTRGVILPALLDWAGPAVATSAKSDLLWDPEHQSGAYAWRRSLGPAWIFDPSGSSGWPCVRWSPLGRSETWQGALRSAHAMVSADKSVTGQEESSTARFFSARASQVLAPALHAVALAGGGMADVLEVVRSAGSLADLADDLEHGLSGASAEALSAVRALRAGSDASSGDTLATVANLLAPYDDPKVAEATSDVEFWPELLLDSSATLFIVAGPDSTRLAPLFACLLDEIFSAVAEKALKDGPLSHRLLMALDEVANIAPVPELPQRLAAVSGQGVTVLTAWQSVSQMRRWGPHAQSQILGNSAAQLWAATDDPETSEHLSRTLGRRLVQTTSVTTDPQRGWLAPRPQPKSVSTSWQERAVLDPSAMRLLQGGPLLVAQGFPPTHLQWRFHDQDRALRARSALEPARTERETTETAQDELEVESNGRRAQVVV